MIGVSYSPPEENKRFAQENGFPYRLLSDVDRKIAETYHTRRPDDDQYAIFPRRVTFLIDPDGIIRKSYLVKDVEGHPMQLLYDLGELQKS